MMRRILVGEPEGNRRSRSLRHAIPVAGGALALALGVGAGPAFAYFASHGSGAGAGKAGTVSLSATVTAGSGLYPGATAPVTVVVKNTSASTALTLESLAQNGTTAIQTAGKGTCDPSVVTFTAGALPTGSVSAGSSVSVTGTVTMATAAADGCQGTTFSIPLQATGQTS